MHIHEYTIKTKLAPVPIFLLRVESSSKLYVGSLSFLAGFFIGGPANMISSAISADLGKDKSIKGSPEAMATVAGIIDGTASFGAAITQYAVALISGRLASTPFHSKHP